jgi:hypothetical protein
MPVATAVILSRVTHQQEPDAVRALVKIHRGIRRIDPVVLWEELGFAKRRLNSDTRGPDALREERCGYVGPLSGSLAALKSHHDRGKQADCSCIVASAREWPRRRRPGIAR